MTLLLLAKRRWTNTYSHLSCPQLHQKGWESEFALNNRPQRREDRGEKIITRFLKLLSSSWGGNDLDSPRMLNLKPAAEIMKFIASLASQNARLCGISSLNVEIIGRRISEKQWDAQPLLYAAGRLCQSMIRKTWGLLLPRENPTGL